MTETAQENEQFTPGHGQGGGQLPPITDPYVTIAGDTLPGIAERAGHSGEWQELALNNIGQVDIPDVSDEAKAVVVADRSQYAGVSLDMPPAWNIGAQTKPAAAEARNDPKSVAETLEEFEREHQDQDQERHRRR